ncbi:MAG: SagB/ThcOx family dehydrogenase [Candidatus Kapaibacteriota bacterium]|jgi:SagB-type dehydrogenase family enzyme
MEIMLPKANYEGRTSLEKVIATRRSVRNFKDEGITLSNIAQLLWAAQGVTDKINRFRTAPSAGALYPLEVFVAVRKADGLDPGVYRYLPDGHKLVKIKDGDVSKAIMKEALWQEWVEKSAIIIVYSAVFGRTTWKYGERGIQYVYMEVGHSAQNVCLQAVSLGLATTTIGAFNDAGIKSVIGMKENETPLYILPVGIPK